MGKWMLGTAMMGVLLGAAVGCSSGSGARSGSLMSGGWLGSNQSKSTAVAPDLATSSPKSGGKYQKKSSVFDYPGQPEPEPGMWAKTTQAVSGSATAIAAGFKNTTQKAVDAFSTKEGEFVDDPISLSTPGKKPNANFYLAVARVHERSHRLTHASDAYQKALKEDPKHLAATLGYARVLDLQGKVADAEKQYMKATADHPKEASGFNDLGLFYGRQKRFEEAREAMTKAVNLQPDRKLYRNNLSTVLVYLKQPEEAFRHLSAVHPPDVAYYNVAFLLVQQEDYNQGLAHLDLALAANPQLEEARQYREMLVAQMGGNRSPVEIREATASRPQPPAAPTASAGPQLNTSAASSAWPRQEQTASLPPGPTASPAGANFPVNPPGGFAPGTPIAPSRY